MVIENQHKFLKILINGLRSYSECILSLEKIFDSGSTVEFKFLVIDECLTCFSVSEVFNIILEILKHSEEEAPHTKIAYCNKTVEAIDMVSFAETVSVNRGLNLKGFTNEQEATHWLLRDVDFNQ